MGLGDEPHHWQPPDDWVTVAAWPGADPAHTGPAPIHHALLNDGAPPVQVAANLGISLGHLRQVLRRHPLPRTRRAWHRALGDIAAQVGCAIQTLNRFARDHGIPIRTRGTSIYTPASATPGHPPAGPTALQRRASGPRRSVYPPSIAGQPHRLGGKSARSAGPWRVGTRDRSFAFRRADSRGQQHRARRSRYGPGPGRRQPQMPGTGIQQPHGRPVTPRPAARALRSAGFNAVFHAELLPANLATDIVHVERGGSRYLPVKSTPAAQLPDLQGSIPVACA